MSHLLRASQGIYYVSLTWYWTSWVHVMVNWQLSKKVSADQCHMTASWAQVYNSLRWHKFYWFSSDCGLRSIFLRWEFCLLSAYGKSWITWPWLNPYIKEANFCQEVLNPQGLICRCLLYSLTSYPSLLPSFTCIYTRNKYVVNPHKTWCGSQVKPYRSGVQTGWVTCCECCVLRTRTCFFTLLYYHHLFTKLW